MCHVQWFWRPEFLEGESYDAYLFFTGAEEGEEVFGDKELFMTETHDDFDICELMDDFKRCVALVLPHFCMPKHRPILASLH